jgi:hypothetical protein
MAAQLCCVDFACVTAPVQLKPLSDTTNVVVDLVVKKLIDKPSQVIVPA